MGNPWAGPLAKAVVNKKRGRTFYTVFFSVCLLVVLVCSSFFIYRTVCDYITISTNATYVDCKNGKFTTENTVYELAPYDNQEIKASAITNKVKKGDDVTLVLSKVEGTLIEIKHNEVSVYKRELVPIWLGAPIFIIAISLYVFMLIVTNIKNPGKRIDKLQSLYLLRFYN